MARRGNSEGTITRRQDGRWEARLVLSDGKRRSLYGKTRKEVADKLASAVAARKQGLPVVPERQSLQEFLIAWLRDTVSQAVRPSTARGYESKIRIHIIPGLGRNTLAKLTPQQVAAFFRAKSESGLSALTVRHLRAILRAALNDAMKMNLVHRNVAALVDGPRVPFVEINPLHPDEAKRLLETVRTHRLSALVSVALAIGLRQGEALGLRWQDIDFDANTLSVRVALQRIKGEFQLVQPKTARSRRTIALPDVVVSALRAHRTRQLEERLAVGPLWEDWGLVFTSPTGHPLHGPNVTITFQKLLADAGLRHQRFYDLRHACASLLLAQGIHARVVMEILGHSNISVTMNTYSHVSLVVQREAAAQMDAILGAR